MIDLAAVDRALSMTQPWASLLAWQEKKWETRGWRPLHRYQFAIHAAKNFPPEARALCATEPFKTVLARHGITDPDQLPLGALLAVGRVAGVARTDLALRCFQERADGSVPDGSLSGVEPGEFEQAFGDYGPDRYAILVSEVEPLIEPVPASGMLNFWRIPDALRPRMRVLRVPAVETLVIQSQRPVVVEKIQLELTVGQTVEIK